MIELLAPRPGAARWLALESAAAARIKAVRVVLERTHKPQNLAAVFRTAEALGVLDVDIVTPQRTAVHRGVARGANRWLRFTRHDAPAAAFSALRRAGFAVAACTVAADGVPLDRFAPRGPTALWFGNERAGVNPDVVAAADVRVFVPMRGLVESLNLSVAAGIVLHHTVSAVIAAAPPGLHYTPDELLPVRARYYMNAVDAPERILAAAGLDTGERSPWLTFAETDDGA